VCETNGIVSIAFLQEKMVMMDESPNLDKDYSC